jgi:Tol biopolymer transport system component
MIARLMCSLITIVMLTVACGHSVNGEEQSLGSGIIYMADDPKQWHSITAEGSHKQLFNAARFGVRPKLKWSPDATKLLIGSSGSVYTSTLRMQSEGEPPFLLLPQGYLAADKPSWSPDSERVVVTARFWHDMAVDRPRGGTSNSPDWRTALLMVNADGSNLRQIAGPYVLNDNMSTFGYGVESGGWSPDGSRLVYWTTEWRHRLYGCNVPWSPVVVPEVEYCPYMFWRSRVYLMDGEGVSRQLILNVDGLIETLSWSPDGEWFLLSMRRDDDEVIREHSVLYRMRSDGTDLQQLTHPNHPTHVDESPALSPDGSTLWFLSNRSEGCEARGSFQCRWVSNRHVYVMKADGSETTAVTEEEGSKITRVYWSPDSQYLASDSYEAGCWKIFLHHIESSTKNDLGCLGTLVAWLEPQALDGVHTWFHDPS